MDTSSDLGTEGAQAAAAVGDNGNTSAAVAQPDQNISILENSNTESGNNNTVSVGEAWRGDVRYFQTGKKAGTLKPSAQTSGADAEKAAREFSGLDLDGLRITAGDAKAKESAKAETKARITKAEKRATESKIAASLVMRCLDVIVDYISGGEYGADFSQDQIKARLTYREQLQGEWETYLATLDLPMHPALVVIAGSVMYAAPALSTPTGAGRVEKMKARLFGWWSRRGAK